MNEDVGKISHINSWEDIKKVFKNNLEEVPGVEAPFKEGAYGKLWKIKGKDLTLKLTTDLLEMETARDLLNKDTNAFLKIHKIIEIPKHESNGKSISPLQLRIQELCYPIKELEGHTKLKAALIDNLRGNFSLRGKLNSKKDVEDYFQSFQDLPKDDHEPTRTLLQSITQYPIVSKKLNEFVLKVADLLDRLSKDITDPDKADDIDFRDRNVMQDKKGTWKLVDF